MSLSSLVMCVLSLCVEGSVGDVGATRSIPKSMDIDSSFDIEPSDGIEMLTTENAQLRKQILELEIKELNREREATEQEIIHLSSALDADQHNMSMIAVVVVMGFIVSFAAFLGVVTMSAKPTRTGRAAGYVLELCYQAAAIVVRGSLAVLGSVLSALSGLLRMVNLGGCVESLWRLYVSADCKWREGRIEQLLAEEKKREEKPRAEKKKREEKPRVEEKKPEKAPVVAAAKPAKEEQPAREKPEATGSPVVEEKKARKAKRAEKPAVEEELRLRVDYALPEEPRKTERKAKKPAEPAPLAPVRPVRPSPKAEVRAPVRPAPVPSPQPVASAPRPQPMAPTRSAPPPRVSTAPPAKVVPKVTTAVQGFEAAPAPGLACEWPSAAEATDRRKGRKAPEPEKAPEKAPEPPAYTRTTVHDGPPARAPPALPNPPTRPPPQPLPVEAEELFPEIGGGEFFAFLEDEFEDDASQRPFAGRFADEVKGSPQHPIGSPGSASTKEPSEGSSDTEHTDSGSEEDKARKPKGIQHVCSGDTKTRRRIAQEAALHHATAYGDWPKTQLFSTFLPEEPEAQAPVTVVEEKPFTWSPCPPPGSKAASEPPRQYALDVATSRTRQWW